MAFKKRNDNQNMMVRMYKYRLYPRPKQRLVLRQILDVCRHWYNMCLEERKLAWQFEKRHVTLSQQSQTGIFYRKAFAQAKLTYSQTLQNVASDVDLAFQRFFRPSKNGKRVGFPRFKSYNRFDSFGFPQYKDKKGYHFGVELKPESKRLKIFAVGEVCIRLHRPIEGQIKTTRIKYEAGHWYAIFSCEMEKPSPLKKTNVVLGIDVGLSALITTSAGDKIDHPHYYLEAQKKLRVLQRAYERKIKGSSNKKKALLQLQQQHAHITHQRRDFLHKLSFLLVKYCDVIAVEDLRIANMVKNKKLSKSILDAGWGLFKKLLASKAESAGREVVLVNPRYSSKTCSNCSAVHAMPLTVRWMECECGLSMDRDQNAAINILNWGLSSLYNSPVSINLSP